MLNESITLNDLDKPEFTHQLHVSQDNDGLVVEFRNHQGVTVASAVFEVQSGELKLYSWNEKDEGYDPTDIKVMVEDVTKAKEETFN